MKRFLAMSGVVLIGVLIIATLIAAFLADTPVGAALFGILAVMTVFLPIILFIFMAMVKNKNESGGMTAAEISKYNKRIKKGESPEKIAEEIEAKYSKEAAEEFKKKS